MPLKTEDDFSSRYPEVDLWLLGSVKRDFDKSLPLPIFRTRDAPRGSLKSKQRPHSGLPEESHEKSINAFLVHVLPNTHPRSFVPWTPGLSDGTTLSRDQCYHHTTMKFKESEPSKDELENTFPEVVKHLNHITSPVCRQIQRRGPHHVYNLQRDDPMHTR